ncbi:hypothetical protein Cgig2_000369 [Carnegiea gigantea]|uniref:Uncharacterized protein n=1 Tax=Carnegiea gigantea TaxID=171969 RepID=A0A9Q1K3I3_9CARY|nr:hypothetical protein Cgig2_000369 [Carnegiea gigantea]
MEETPAVEASMEEEERPKLVGSGMLAISIMHITVDNLRSMAKPKRISNSSGAGGPKNSINEYERQRQRTIEKNKRKLTELGIQRTLRSMRRTNETIQRQSQENSDEDDEYNSMEYERLHEEFKAVPSDTPRSSVRKTSFEGHKLWPAHTSNGIKVDPSLSRNNIKFFEKPLSIITIQTIALDHRPLIHDICLLLMGIAESDLQPPDSLPLLPK